METTLSKTDALSTLNQMKQLYHKESGKLQQITATYEKKKNELNKLEVDRGVLELKRLLLQEASEEAREQARITLQTVATNALQYIMGEYMSLEIELSEKGNTPTARFLVKKTYGDYVVYADPAEEEGGGIADIVAFSVFIAMLQLTGHQNVAPLFLDEPSKYVSEGYSDRVASFLYDTSKSIGRQAYMVTHDEFISSIGDKAYHFHIDDEGTSVATEIEQ